MTACALPTFAQRSSLISKTCGVLISLVYGFSQLYELAPAARRTPPPHALPAPSAPRQDPHIAALVAITLQE